MLNSFKDKLKQTFEINNKIFVILAGNFYEIGQGIGKVIKEFPMNFFL